MRTRPLITLGAIALSAASFRLAARETPAGAITIRDVRADTDPIAVIRDRYARITRELSTYRRTSHPLMDFSTEGGELTGYYDGDRLRLLEALYLGEGGRAKYQYYFWGDSLFFVFSVEEYYARPIYSSPNDSVPPPRIPRHLENRFYFARGKLVRWIDSAGHPRRVLDTAAVRWEDQLRSGAVFLARCAASSAADSLACADTTN